MAGDKEEFHVLAHMPVQASLLADLKMLMHATVNNSAIVAVTHAPQATPTKWLPMVVPAAWPDAAAEPLSVRRGLA